MPSIFVNTVITNIFHFTALFMACPHFIDKPYCRSFTILRDFTKYSIFYVRVIADFLELSALLHYGAASQFPL